MAEGGFLPRCVLVGAPGLGSVFVAEPKVPVRRESKVDRRSQIERLVLRLVFVESNLRPDALNLNFLRNRLNRTFGEFIKVAIRLK